MQLSDFLINDIKIQSIKEPVKHFRNLFNELTYSHLPIEKKGKYVGCIFENDVRCFDSDKTIEDYEYAVECFFVTTNDNWLEVIKTFSDNNTNLMPVIDEETKEYIGYFELNDIMTLFNDTPFLKENGAIIVVQKSFEEYSLSEIAQIVESSNSKLIGAFISKIENDMAEVTLKTNSRGVNEVIQSFRRYGYQIISSHQEDMFTKNLKDRARYLDKYLNT